jgi:hypothetical protein
MKAIYGVCAWAVTLLLLAFVAGPLPTESRAAGAKATTPPKPQQLYGNVVSCDEKTLIVRSRKGEEFKFSINIESQFGPKGSSMNITHFKAGNHVQVTYVRNRNERVLKQVVHVVKHIN